VRDPEALTRAFAYHPAYFHWEESATNFVELGPQNSRSFRALKVWLALRQAGAAGYRRMIGDDVALSRYMAEVLRKNPAFEVTSQSLSITTFRYVPEDRRSSVGTEATERYLNELNADLNDRIQKSGEAFVSNAVIRGRYVLRACIVNFHTTRADVDALPEIVARIGRAVDSEKRRS
jgi:glutamate/tyrosine decarboxylase-like PLP-dependent enzyme